MMIVHLMGIRCNAENSVAVTVFWDHNDDDDRHGCDHAHMGRYLLQQWNDDTMTVTATVTSVHSVTMLLMMLSSRMSYRDSSDTDGPLAGNDDDDHDDTNWLQVCPLALIVMRQSYY